MAKAAKETPLMKQYNAIKAKYPGALLLFRVGDFYETFGEDAVKTSKILDIVLTKRANGAAAEMELAGFPHHSLDTYLPKLVRAGERVAICDQLEDPKQAKGIVKRGITEMVTPGVSFNDNVLQGRQNNFLCSVYLHKGKGGIAFLDISTGEFNLAEGEVDYLQKLLQSFQPTEILYSKAQREQIQKLLSDEVSVFRMDDWAYALDFATNKLTEHFGTASLKGYGVEEQTLGVIAAGAALQYLELTGHKQLKHIQRLARIDEDKYVWLDKFTIRNLELVSSLHSNGISLLQILDHCLTPMGARLLHNWIVLPLRDKAAITQRLDMVQVLKEQRELAEKVGVLLRHVGDLQRLISKVAANRVNPRELVRLHQALQQLKPLKELFTTADNKVLKTFADRLHPCQALLERLEEQLEPEAPTAAAQGGVICKGVEARIDELRDIATNGKDYLQALQNREAERTGISSLKIAYNKVFGYYLEVRNVHKAKVPPEWVRKQTLVNAERYITEELKQYEEKILTAEDELAALEEDCFNKLVTFTSEYIPQILHSLAEAAYKFNYHRPALNDSLSLSLTENRHPVIERQLPPGESYIANSVELDDEQQQIIIITGPNMSGKSALLRQVALTVLMAQMGSFVPADAAEIGLVDKVFTRVGASDNLSQGESTFMVEMTETASILNNLSERSLVLMDEIGRGTSTYDGISIAWALVEHLHNHPQYRPKTLFATHYHELNALAEKLPRIHNYSVSVQEAAGKIIFLRKLQKGGSEHSFGIHVAQLAGMPPEVVKRSEEILSLLEAQRGAAEQGNETAVTATSEAGKSPQLQHYQLTLFGADDPVGQELLKRIKVLDINALSPVEALLKLNEFKKLAGEGNPKPVH